MKKLLTIFAFCFLLFVFSPVAARAEVTCPDGGAGPDPNDPNAPQCCNYQNSPNHISDPDPEGRCNEDHCERKTFTGSFPYGGECKYCNRLVTVRNDGCSGCGCTCNQSCATEDDDDDDDEPPADYCPVPDYETDPCCPIEFPLSDYLPEWLKTILNALTEPLNILFETTVALKDNKLEHAHVKELAEDYLGTHNQNYNDGVMTKLMPPNHIFIEEKAERERVRDTWGKLEVTVGSEGEEGEEKTIEGADWYPYKLDYATTFLKALTRIPGQEDAYASSLREETECEPAVIKLASVPATGTVLAATDDELCHDVLPGTKHSACVAEETSSAEISFTRALESVLSGTIKIYPRLSFLDKIHSQTIGPGGFFRIFDIPGEEHEEYDGETESDLEIDIRIPLIGGDDPVVSFGVTSEGKGIFHTGTEKKAHENILQKLSIPGGED